MTHLPTEMDTEAAVPPPPAEAGAADPGNAATVTATVTASAGQPQPAAGQLVRSGPQEIVRHGPGVPAVPAGGQAAGQAAGQAPTAQTAEQVWRTGLPATAPRRSRPLRRLAGPALSVILLIASAVVIYLRLHHAPFGVTGVAITQQVKNGCAQDVTGRISTTGGAGIVSYQWVFQPQLAAPQPLSQTVAAGQSAVYVTAAVQGQGHGTLAQTVTLQILGPGHGSASAHVVVSC